MQIKISFKSMPFTPSLKRYAESRIGEAMSESQSPIPLVVEVTCEKIDSEHHTYCNVLGPCASVVSAVGSNMSSALDAVADKLQDWLREIGAAPQTRNTTAAERWRAYHLREA